MGQTWRTQPWCIYAVHLTSLVNFALFYDAALIGTLYMAEDLPISTTPRLLSLSLWILCTKLVKPLPHFRRNPRDLVYLPGCILFGYFHSLIKLGALFTLANIAWGSRPLGDEEQGLLDTAVDETEGEAALGNQPNHGTVGNSAAEKSLLETLRREKGRNVRVGNSAAENALVEIWRRYEGRNMRVRSP